MFEGGSHTSRHEDLAMFLLALREYRSRNADRNRPAARSDHSAPAPPESLVPKADLPARGLPVPLRNQHNLVGGDMPAPTIARLPAEYAVRCVRQKIDSRCEHLDAADRPGRPTIATKLLPTSGLPGLIPLP